MPGIQNQTEIEQDDKLVKKCTVFGIVSGTLAGGVLAGIVEGYPEKHVFRGKQLFFRKVGLWGTGAGLATGFLSYAILRSPIAKNPDTGKIIAAGLVGGTPGICIAAEMFKSQKSPVKS